MKRKKYYGWDGYCLESETLEIGIVPEIGGRMISLKCEGEELLFVDNAHIGETFDFSGVEDLAAEKRKLGFRLWGGDKTWVAPETNWIEGVPSLELDAMPYKVELEDHAITMTSPVCRETGVQIIRRIELISNDNPEPQNFCDPLDPSSRNFSHSEKYPGSPIHLNQTFINKSDKPIQVGIWNVTQMLRPFTLYFPTKKERLIPDTRFEASTRTRDQLTSQQGRWTKIDCFEPMVYKYGANIEEGIALALRYQNGHTIAMIREFEIDKQAIYPHGDMVEVYNSSDYNYFEFEVLAPLVKLNPGEQTSHTQSWRVQKFEGELEPDEILFL